MRTRTATPPRRIHSHGIPAHRIPAHWIAAHWIALALLLPLLGGTAYAGEAPPTRKQIQADLELVAGPLGKVHLRPGQPVRLEAKLWNRSKSRSHKVVDPGTGSELGCVEPHIYYAARFVPHEGATREIRSKRPVGMCGMGDYSWMPRVQDLAPGASLDFGKRMASATMSLQMKTPGRYDVQVHYAFRAKGATQKLPGGDPIGKLGPMQGVPSFEIVSRPVRFDVVRPFEVFVEVTGTLRSGATQALSDLLTVRVENWSDKPLTLSNTKFKLLTQVQAGKGNARIKRLPMDFPAVVLSKVLKPGEGMVMLGPQAGWFGEEWQVLGDGPVDVRFVAVGYEPGGARTASHIVRIPGSKP